MRTTTRTLMAAVAAAAISLAGSAGAALADGGGLSPATGPTPSDTHAVPNTKGVAGADHVVTPNATVPNRAAAIFPTLKPGASNFYQTRALQYVLLGAGYKTNWESSYGASTTSAVRAFQTAKKLPVTGVADNATLAALTPTLGYGANNYGLFGIQTLLKQHGYHWSDANAPVMTTIYNDATRRMVWAFQRGHGIGAADVVGYYTWRTLFNTKNSGPLYPLRQAGTGAAQWSNCGPVSAVAILISLGKTPQGWDWNPAGGASAVYNFRYGAMKLPNTTARNAIGTEFFELQPGFAAYGVPVWHGGITDTITAAKAGYPSLAGGDAYQLSWDRNVTARGPVSHWVAVLGFDGTNYLVIDPLSSSGANYVHLLSESQLRTYAATNPGYPTNKRLSPPWLNSVIVGSGGVASPGSGPAKTLSR